MKLWTSDLETFRYWLESKDRAEAWDKPEVELTDADLLAELRREFKPTRDMKAGTAFHNALEFYAGYNRPIEVGETTPFRGRDKWFRFTFEVCVEFERPRSVESYFRLDVGDHFLTGKVDAITRTALVDYKTSAKPPKRERFFDSWQWRVYLLAHPKVNRMRYDLFQLKASGPPEMENGDAVLPYSVIDHAAVEVWRYPGMREDVKKAVARFVNTTRPLGWEGRK